MPHWQGASRAMNFRLVAGPHGTITLSGLKPGQTFNIAVKAQRGQRSNKQNNFYWGPFIGAFLADHRFKKWTPEQVHDALKAKFLSTIDPVTGLLEIGSTTENDTLEQEQYHDRIRQWAAESLDIYVPDPNE
jgi:hypothetical protein